MRKTTLIRNLFTFLLFVCVSWGVKGQEREVLYYEYFGTKQLNWTTISINDYDNYSESIKPIGGVMWAIFTYDEPQNKPTNNFLFLDSDFSTSERSEVFFNFGDKFKSYAEIQLGFSFNNLDGDIELYFKSAANWVKKFSSSEIGSWVEVTPLMDLDDYLSDFQIKIVKNGSKELAVDDIKITGLQKLTQSCENPEISSGIYTNDDILEVPQNFPVTIKCNTPGSKITYRVNGGVAIETDTNEFTISNLKSNGDIVCWASVVLEDGQKKESEIVEKKIKILSRIDRKIFNYQATNNLSYVMVPELINQNKLKSTKLDVSDNSELIITHLNQIWDIYASVKNPQNYYIYSETGSFLSVENMNLTLNQTATPWQFDVANDVYYYSQIETGDEFIFTIQNEGTSGDIIYTLLSKELPTPVSSTIPSNCLFKLSGNHKVSSLNEIFKMPNLKWVDILSATFVLDADYTEPNNPNCLIFTNLRYAWTHRVRNNTCENLNLKDKRNFQVPYGFNATNATYTRQAWQDGGWETVVIPFEVGQAGLPEGYIFDEFVGISEDRTEIRFRQVTSLSANTPYLMKKVAPGITSDTALCVFRATERVAVPLKIDHSTFVGIYEKTMTQDKFILGINKKGQTIFGKGTANSYVMPFRAYLDITLPTGAAPMHVVHMVDDATALDDTKEAEWYAWGGEPGEIVIRTPVEKNINVISVEGRLIRSIKIKAGEEIISGLSKGLYIVNGKKIVVK